MEKLKKNLNTIGLGLILLALIAMQVWPHRKAVLLVLALGGAAAGAVYIALNLSSLKRSVSRKSFLYSGNLLLIVVLVLAILVLLNYFLSRHNLRFDFTEAKLHSLSDQSIQVLKNLDKDVQIKGFFREGNYSRSKLEALLKATRKGKKVIYFLEGHGEHSIEQTEDVGFSFAKDELQKLGYESKKLALALSETFPQDCALLFVPGPQKDLLPNELETIQTYIYGGGRVFFMAH